MLTPDVLTPDVLTPVPGSANPGNELPLATSWRSPATLSSASDPTMTRPGPGGTGATFGTAIT